MSIFAHCVLSFLIGGPSHRGRHWDDKRVCNRLRIPCSMALAASQRRLGFVLSSEPRLTVSPDQRSQREYPSKRSRHVLFRQARPSSVFRFCHRNTTKCDHELLGIVHQQPHLAILIEDNWSLHALSSASETLWHQHGHKVGNCMPQQSPRACHILQQIPQRRPPVY